MKVSIKKLLVKVLKRANLRVIETTGSSATSVAANGGTAWLTAPIPTNCTVIYPIGYYLSGGYNCSVYAIGINSAHLGTVAVRNNGSAAQSVTLTMRYLVID